MRGKFGAGRGAGFQVSRVFDENKYSPVWS